MNKKRLLALFMASALILQSGMAFAADVAVENAEDDVEIVAQTDGISRTKDDIEIEEQDPEIVEPIPDNSDMIATGTDTGEESFTVDAAEEEIVAKENVQVITIDDNASVANGTCGKNLTWTLDENGLLTVSGTGEIPDYITVAEWGTDKVLEENKAPWDDYLNQIKEIFIGEGVTKIGYAAFADCHNLQKVTIDSTVTYIRHSAFSNASSLVEVVGGSGIKKMESDIFYGAPLTSLTLSKKLTELDSGALLGLEKLQNIYLEPGNTTYQSCNGVLFADSGKTIYSFPAGRTGTYTIPSGVTTIGESAFSKSALSSIEIPNSVTKIEDNAFAYCKFQSISIPNSVTEIGQLAFYWCKNLTSMTFPVKIKTLPYAICAGDSSLTAVTIPEGVEQIGINAFSDCTSLETVTLPTSVISVGECAFSSTKNVICKNTSLYAVGKTYVNGVQVKITAQESYKKAFEILQIVNQERTKVGADPLTMDVDLLEAAMQRAAETTLNYSHTRPSGESCFTTCDKMFGENIALGTTTASAVMNTWMNSAGHKANILDDSYKSIGVGCVYWNNTYYWVQCFGLDQAATANISSYVDKTTTRKVVVKKDTTYYKAKLLLPKSELTVGESIAATVTWNGKPLSDSGAVIQSSNTKVCTLSGGKMKAVGAGTTKISMYFPGYEEKVTTETVIVKGKTSAHQHTYKTIITKAKTTANGKTTTKCSVCGSVKSTGTIYAPKTATLSKVSYTYDKKVKKPTVTVKDSVGKKIAASNYSVTYAKGRKNVGSYKVTVKFKSTSKNYTGSLSTTFQINPKATTLKSVTAAKKGFTAKWKKLTTQTTGYQIQYATNSKFTSGAKTVTVTKNKTTSKKITKLKAKKKYYVRIRTYKTVSGTKYVSAWSKAKTVTTKK
ncbi:MAG: leucine-rich repeat protein [Eubacteriales bacterium]|nr:leucine-rich repeat protein [Eubacteriales bacterium]